MLAESDMDAFKIKWEKYVMGLRQGYEVELRIEDCRLPIWERYPRARSDDLKRGRSTIGVYWETGYLSEAGVAEELNAVANRSVLYRCSIAEWRCPLNTQSGGKPPPDCT